MSEKKELLNFLEKEIISSEGDAKPDAGINIDEIDNLIGRSPSDSTHTESGDLNDSYGDGLLLDVDNDFKYDTTINDNEGPFLNDEVNDIVEEVSENQESIEATDSFDAETLELPSDEFFSNDESSGEDEEIALSGDELDTIVEGVSEVQEEPTLSPKTEEVIPDLSEPSTDDFFLNDKSSGEDEFFFE